MDPAPSLPGSVSRSSAAPALPRRTVALALLLILSLSGFLRFYRFTSVPPGLFSDEAADGNDALAVVHAPSFWRAMQPFYPADNGREGLYINVVAVLIKLAGGVHRPWILRLPAAVSGILTVLGLYFLAAELLGTAAGLLSAFLIATCFWHINFSRIAFRAILAPLLLTWSLYLLIRALRRLRDSPALWGALSLSLLGGLLFGLGAYTYIAFRVCPLLALLVFTFYWPIARRGGWRRGFFLCSACFILAAVLVFLPLGAYFYSHPGSFFGRSSQLSVGLTRWPLLYFLRNVVRTLGMFNFVGDRNWRHNISRSPELFWPVGLLLAYGVFEACRAMRAASGRARDGAGLLNPSAFPFTLLLSWFLLAMLPAVLTNQDIPHSLRTILMIPPAIVLAAFGGCRLCSLLQGRIAPLALRAASIVFLAFVAVHAYTSYFIVWARNPNLPQAFDANSAAVGLQLDALPAAVPKYVVVEPPPVGLSIDGAPALAQAAMFLSDTSCPDGQQSKNVHYLLPADAGQIPPGAIRFHLP